eukprot:1161602-Pelagomonas_calceolata.AAC.13
MKIRKLNGSTRLQNLAVRTPVAFCASTVAAAVYFWPNSCNLAAAMLEGWIRHNRIEHVRELLGWD